MIGDDDACSDLIAQPFTYPAFVQAASVGKLYGIKCVWRIGQGSVNAQTIADVDHSRSDGSGQLGEDVEREHLELIGVRLSRMHTPKLDCAT